ncbi:MAG TPA: GntR family transcriptional regulator [Moorella mulderi]|nr:GntR family transcriptional regulator [Moorella mulderi]
MKRYLKGKLSNYKPLREIVFEALKEAILEGHLKTGEKLMEIQLAEELGVSRTPVREAIRKLEQEGLVVIIPHKGAFVADLSMKDIADLFEVRAALESLAAALACERATEEELEEMERLLMEIGKGVEEENLEYTIEVDTKFHEVLYQASRNALLVKIINNLQEKIQTYRTTSLSMPGRMAEALEEHRRLLEAIAAREVDLAQRLAQEHIENAANRVMEAIRTRGKA